MTLKLKGKIPELAQKPDDPRMKIPENVQALKRQSTANYAAVCPIELQMKIRRDAGSDKEVVKSNKPVDEPITALK